MVRDRFAAWGRRILLNRIISAQDRANGVHRRRSLERWKRTAVLACVGTLGAYAVADAQHRPDMSPAPQEGACIIKGNISDRGERIYHMPGGAFYDRTRISSAKGERWFCTEADARAAGWRRSKR